MITAFAIAAVSLIQGQTATLNLAGTYAGHIQLKPPKEVISDQMMREQVENSRKEFAKMKMVLALTSNGRYKSSATGTPDKKNHSAEGVWTLKGFTLSLKPKLRDGKAPKGDGANVQSFDVSKDGKTLTRDLPQNSIAIVFERSK